MAFAGFRAADWSIDRDVTPSLISYIGDDHVGVDPSYATVLEFHRGISDMADDATSVGDDEHDITDPDATDRSTDNIITLLAGYNLNAAAKEHLYDGSIIFNEDGKIWDGIVNFGNSTTIQIIQNGAVLTDDWWNNDPFGAGFGLNGDAAAGISHRFLIETRDNSPADIDGRRLIGTSRSFNNTYAEFSINGSARGNNVLALSEGNDIFNNASAANVSGWVITNTEGYQGIDITGDGADEFYYSQWDDTVGTGTGRAGTINDVYEYFKWAIRDGSAETLYGLSGELFRGITHEISVQSGTQSATDFSAVEPVSWTGGTGQMLAVDDVNAATTMWIQLLTGVAPGDGVVITGGTSGATITTAASNAVTDRRGLLTPVSVGASTGSNIIGGYGVGFATGSVGSSDQAFDLTNTQRIPPNNVTFTLSNLDNTVSNEDRILIGPEDGASGLDYNQLALNATLSTDVGTGTIVVSTAIPGDTPTSGYIRVLDNNGRYRRISYSSWTGSTFTINEGLGGEADFSTVNATAGNNVFIAYMDRIASGTSEQFTGVNLNRTLFIRVRNAGNTPIKPFTSTATVTNADATVSVGRISDA
jgi:hypothetical protein